jgi:hypothetical protein
MRSELKLEVGESFIEEVVKKSFNGGKTIGEVKFNIPSELEESLNGLNNSTIKLYNLEKIEGFLKMIITSDNFLKPMPIYSIQLEDGRYSFY